MINEEISSFDFLGNVEYSKEEEILNTLKNEDFQKQFICDSLINKKNIKTKVTDANVGGNWEQGNDASKLTIEYSVEIEYLYDQNKKPLSFTVDFSSENVSVDISATYDPGNWANFVEPTSESQYNYIQWSDISVMLFTSDGDEIDFLAFKRAPQKIQDMFIRSYTENFISNNTTSTDNLKKDSIRSTPYC